MRKTNIDKNGLLICPLCNKGGYHSLSSHFKSRYNFHKMSAQEFKYYKTSHPEIQFELEEITKKRKENSSGDKNGMFGKYPTEETRKLLSIAGKKGIEITNKKLRQRSDYHEWCSKNAKRLHKLRPDTGKHMSDVCKLKPNYFEWCSERGKKNIRIVQKRSPYIWEGVNFLSNAEMKCAKLLLTKPIYGVNCHIEVGNKTIDFYPQEYDKLYQGKLVEYHPWDLRGKTNEEYYNDRKKAIDNSSYKGTELILITNLNDLKVQ